MIEAPKDVLRRHGLAARKQWGQHFLRDHNVHAAIVHAAGLGPDDRVVEIGAGLGTLTAHLLQTGAEVWAIERDRDLCHVLRAELGEHPRFSLYEADAVKFDYASAAGSSASRNEPAVGLSASSDEPETAVGLCALSDEPETVVGSGASSDEPPIETDPCIPTIVGNLPYHLTGPLMFRLLDAQAVTGPWVVMIQKEVADRLCADPGSRTYGGITAALSRVRRIRGVMHVPPGAFLPPPRVDSAVIRLDPLPSPRGEVADTAGYLALVRAAFQRRRKTLLNALSSLAPKDRVRAWCDQAGVDSRLRPERLGPEEFAALQRAREADRA